MAGLIFMIYLRVKSHLETPHSKRLLVLAMSGIDKMRSPMKLYLRDKLRLKCKLIHEPEGRRKRLIWGRREAAAKANGKKWKERVEKRVEKMEAEECVKKLILRKVRKWTRNAEKDKE